MIIILMRHGETKLNKMQLIQGQSNYPLTRKGKAEILDASKRLMKIIPQIDYFLSSPLKRALQSCKIVQKYYNNKDEIKIDQDLIERNFGALEMAPVKELPYFLNDTNIEDYENNQALSERMLTFLEKITSYYHKDNIIFIASHSHSIKGILVSLFKEFDYKSKIKNGEYIILNYDKTRVCLLY